MLFNSFEFFIFLPLVFIAYWLLQKREYQNIFILICSYFFYGFWSWKFLLVLIFSTLVDYGFAFFVTANSQKGRLFFWLCILNNLLLLGIFKYYDFFVVEFQQLMQIAGFHVNVPLLRVALPVGISFYTFHGLSYVIDVYKGNYKPVRSFIDYAVFVCYFPLLVAGPIERANHLIPQIQKEKVFSYEMAVSGLRLILWGFFKKIIIADSLSFYVEGIWHNYQHEHASTLVLGAIYFAIQVYCDFSGYTDIARGSAKLLGIDLVINFNRPFFSKSVSEFWLKWHISLSTWFSDYVFKPIAIELRQLKNTGIAIAVFMTFSLSGLWHGAGWNFIIYGMLHGCAVIIEMLSRKQRRLVSKKIPDSIFGPLCILLTFSFVCTAWIFFRSPTLDIALKYIAKILSVDDLFVNPADKFGFFYIGCLILCNWFFRYNEQNTSKFFGAILFRRSVYAFLSLLIFQVFIHQNQQSFIYFQF